MFQDQTKVPWSEPPTAGDKMQSFQQYLYLQYVNIQDIEQDCTEHTIPIAGHTPFFTKVHFA